MCMIHNEHKSYLFVSWSIVTPWYSIENIWFIQLSHNDMFIYFFCNDRQVKWIKGKGAAVNMYFYLFNVILKSHYVNILWYAIFFMSPFSLNPSVQRLLDAWLGYRCKSIPQRCVVHASEQNSLECDSVIGVLLLYILHLVSYCPIDPSALALDSKCT